MPYLQNMPLKTWILVAEVLIHRVRDGVGTGVAAVVMALGLQQDELFGVLDRQQFQHELIDEAKNRGVCADPQRQRSHGHNGE